MSALRRRSYMRFAPAPDVTPKAIPWEAIGGIISVVGLVLTGWQPSLIWSRLVVGFGVIVLLAGIVRTAAPRVVRTLKAWQAWRKLLRHWPEFQAKAKTYADFYDFTFVYNLASPLQPLDGLDLAKPVDAALNAKREFSVRQIGFLGRLAFDLVTDLNRRPQHLTEARTLVKRFETIAAGPAALGIEAVYDDLIARSPRPKDLEERMRRLEGFKRGYEDFAKASNEDVGTELFREYLP